MSTIDIKITNLAEIKAAFTKSPKLMTRELNKAIRKVVLTIGAQSMRNTPVDTGRLRASTYESFGNLKGEVGTNTKYDIYVHEGTRYMKARPYLYNAVKSSSEVTDKFFTEAVDSVLNEIGRSI
jgi:HK97 gp10 family phage protein